MMSYESDEQPAPLCTYAALAAMVAVFAAEYTRTDLSALEPFSWRLGQGETWRLITPTFLHGSVLHILFNAILFFHFSRVLENWLGPWIVLVLYAFLGAASNAAEVLVSGRPVVENGMVYIAPGLVEGASGVVYGFFGFLWAVRLRRSEVEAAVTPYLIEAMLGWLAVCAVLSYFNVPIANMAHASGLAVGWLLGRAVAWRSPWRWAVGAAGVLLGGMLIACTYGPVWHATLGHIPACRRWYDPDDPGPVFRNQYEHPQTLNPPGVFGMP